MRPKNGKPNKNRILLRGGMALKGAKMAKNKEPGDVERFEGYILKADGEKVDVAVLTEDNYKVFRTEANNFDFPIIKGTKIIIDLVKSDGGHTVYFRELKETNDGM